VDSIEAAVPRQLARFGEDSYRMMFITNHDENSWNGTIGERMGPNGDAMAVLSGTLMGMPLVYSGQEAGNKKRLRFFEKDTVIWGDYAKTDLYQTIYALHHEQEALWNGKYGGQPVFYEVQSESAMAWKRTKNGNDVVTAVNLGDAEVEMNLGLDDTFQSAWGAIEPGATLILPGHSASVWTRTE